MNTSHANGPILHPILRIWYVLISPQLREVKFVLCQFTFHRSNQGRDIPNFLDIFRLRVPNDLPYLVCFTIFLLELNCRLWWGLRFSKVNDLIFACFSRCILQRSLVINNLFSLLLLGLLAMLSSHIWFLRTCFVLSAHT